VSPPGPEREGPLSPPGHPKGEHRSAEREGNSLTAPDLTVVVTVVEGGTALTRCLEALSAQIDAPAMEIIVPFDSTMQQVNDLASRFPDYRFMDLGAVVAPGIRANEFTRHILYDCRRTAGLKAALGRYVAMLEDRGWPRKDWARTMVSLHEQMPHAVIGGAIESGAVGYTVTVRSRVDELRAALRARGVDLAGGPDRFFVELPREMKAQDLLTLSLDVGAPIVELVPRIPVEP